ncbi:hypothetical protein QT369_22535, partial [Xanthomonas citri pv. citri]
LESVLTRLTPAPPDRAFVIAAVSSVGVTPSSPAIFAVASGVIALPVGPAPAPDGGPSDGAAWLVLLAVGLLVVGLVVAVVEGLGLEAAQPPSARAAEATRATRAARGEVMAETLGSPVVCRLWLG